MYLVTSDQYPIPVYKENKLLHLNDAVVFYSEHAKNIYFEDNIIKIYDGHIIVKNKYFWNGCTFVRDGERDKNGIPRSWTASCIHDALYQSKLAPLSRKVKDQIFYEELKRIKFKFFWKIPGSTLYYIGARLFGGITHKLRIFTQRFFIEA